MLPHYEAIYDHGRLTWIGTTPGLVRTRVIVMPVSETDPPDGQDCPLPEQADAATTLPRKRISDEEIARIMREVRGAWGKKTVEEVDAMIRQRRIEDWGEDDDEEML